MQLQQNVINIHNILHFQFKEIITTLVLAG